MAADGMTLDEAPRSGRAARLARLIVVAAVAAFLGWQIVAAGVAALAARSTDVRLLTLTGTPAHPDAAAKLAEGMLLSGDARAAAAIARPVLLADPTNDRALRVLGLATEKLGDRDAASAIMRQAGSLGWRDTPTQLWVLRDAALHDDARAVVRRADALARRGRLSAMTQAVFLASVAEPHLRPVLVESLGRQPTWRLSFFASVRQHLPASSIDGMEALFREMRAHGQAIAPDEWLDYVDRLIDLGEFGRARATWARVFAIPPARLSSVPYDGDFALAAARPANAAVSQFEWTSDPDLAGAVTFAGAGDGVALTAEQTDQAALVSQLLLLAPGSHLLSARVRGDASAAPAGWKIVCLPSGKTLPRRLSRGSGDELSAVGFDVPATGCGAQRLSLEGRERLEAQAVSVGEVRVR